MRADVVLNIARKDYRYISPSEIRKMGRSFWRTSRHFYIQGGVGALNGWENFSESFEVDDIESARYVSWYHCLLTQLYLSGCSTTEVQHILSLDPTTYLPVAFDVATGHPKNPALVLTHHGLRAILGAHAKIIDGQVYWQLEPRYVALFDRLAALAIAIITLYKPDEALYVGWVWQEPRKPWGRRRAWFAESYRPTEELIGSRWFRTPLVGDGWEIAQLYDTNIFVPKRQVNCDNLSRGGLKSQTKRPALSSLAKKNVFTWFS